MYIFPYIGMSIVIKKKKKTVEMILSNIRADFSGTQTQSKILSWPFQLSSNLIHMKEDA